VGAEDGPLDSKELDADTSALPGAVCTASEYGDRYACRCVGCLGFGLKCQGCYAGNKDGRAWFLAGRPPSPETVEDP
jgi:hypothetical protein